MAVEYTRAPEEIEDMAAEIIADHHSDRLGDVEIAFLMRTPTATRGGQIVLGRASKANALQRALAGENFRFVIELSSDEWADLEPSQKRALLDHELCHCGREEDDKGEIKYSIRGHDVEEFQEIVERHGQWTETLQGFARQLELFGEPHLRAVGEE